MADSAIFVSALNLDEGVHSNVVGRHLQHCRGQVSKRWIEAGQYPEGGTNQPVLLFQLIKGVDEANVLPLVSHEYKGQVLNDGLLLGFERQLSQWLRLQ
jgi:hypothetical protein